MDEKVPAPTSKERYEAPGRIKGRKMNKTEAAYGSSGKFRNNFVK